MNTGSTPDGAFGGISFISTALLRQTEDEDDEVGERLSVFKERCRKPLITSSSVCSNFPNNNILLYIFFIIAAAL